MKWLGIGALIILVATMTFFIRQLTKPSPATYVPDPRPAASQSTNPSATLSSPSTAVAPELSTEPIAEPAASLALEVIAENLNIPWEIAFLPNGEMLVTERPGQLILIGQSRTSIPISTVSPVGEGGLLGLALHPDFVTNQYLYLYFTTEESAGLTNRVERYRLSNKTIIDRTVIIRGIPAARNHNGGRLAFGPDKKLYITTGDALTERNAPDINSLGGKILRLNDDGTIPPDNPFGNAVYSLGHRNPQGLAWDNDDNLWITEHGRSGALSGFDEINLIQRGKNYGWPDIQGDETRSTMEVPKAHSGANQTWAPSGAVFIGNDLYFAGLRGQALYQAHVSGQVVTGIDAHLKNRFGRLRTIAQGPDNAIYLLTSNRDGRGTVQAGDDKIIRLRDVSALSAL